MLLRYGQLSRITCLDFTLEIYVLSIIYRVYVICVEFLLLDNLHTNFTMRFKLHQSPNNL